MFTVKNRHQGATLLKAWMENAKDSGLPPIVKVAYTIMNHWDGVLRWFESQITNGILEGFNQPHPIRQGESPGLPHPKNFINMAYLNPG
ncbi:transposase [Acidithiobacillus ferrooxidans]|uniref:transposase n=1 Tax=Acidithiobacillus ferrooxidans TaxID=920 RepID=UPI003AF5E14B